MRSFLAWLAVTVVVSLVVGWWLFHNWGAVIFDSTAVGLRQYAHLVGVLIIIVHPIVYFLKMLYHIAFGAPAPPPDEPLTGED